MGRPPRPTALRAVTGERKDRAKSRVREPIPADREVVPPSWLSIDAVALWRDLAPDLQAKETLTPWDVEAFAGWCDAIVRRARAAEHLDAEGEVVEYDVFDRNGKASGKRSAKNLWMMVWKDANEVAMRLGARFGLTPSERAQLPPTGQPNAAGGAGRLLS